MSTGSGSRELDRRGSVSHALHNLGLLQLPVREEVMRDWPAALRRLSARAPNDEARIFSFQKWQKNGCIDALLADAGREHAFGR
jgi:hypothetical protein